MWSHIDFHSFDKLSFSVLFLLSTNVPLLSPKFHLLFSLVSGGIFGTSHYLRLP